MKYKMSFYSNFYNKWVATCATLLFLFFSSHLFSSSCLSFGSSKPLYPLLHSMHPAHTIINDGENIVIEKSGSYHIVENITGTINIKTSNVIIHLNGFTLAKPVGAEAAILVDPLSENIIIKDGAIVGNGSGYGILLKRTVFAHLENLTLSGFEVGVAFNDTQGVICYNCLVTNCKYYAFELNGAEQCVLEDCTACCIGRRGFYLRECKYNKLMQCKAIKIGPATEDNYAIGFVAESGVDNLFYECKTENVFKDTGDWCEKAIGFRLGYAFVPTNTLKDGNRKVECRADQLPNGDADRPTNNPGETESKIINCCVDSLTGAGLGNAFGISLEFKLLDALTEITKIAVERVSGQPSPINDVDWSPQGDYVAVATSDGELFVLKFDRETETLLPIWSEAPNELPVKAVKWSPDGLHLAVGTEGQLDSEELEAFAGHYEPVIVSESETVNFVTEGEKELFVYRFDGFTLSLVDDQFLGAQKVNAYSDQALLVRNGVNPNDPNADSVTDTGIILPGVADPGGQEDDFFSNHPTPIDPVRAPDSVLRIVWSRDGRHLFVTTEGREAEEDFITGNPQREDGVPGLNYDYTYLNVSLAAEKAKLVYLTFDGKNLTTIQTTELGDLNSSKALAITADDKLLAYGVNDQDNIIKVGKFVPFFGVFEKAFSQLPNGIFVWGADWNPIVCCENYYLAVASGSDGQLVDFGQLDIFEYNPLEKPFVSIYTVTQPESTDFYDVQWSPRGKELVVTSENFFVDSLISDTFDTLLYSFDPTVGLTVLDLQKFGYLTNFDGGPKYVDWSPCSKYLVLAGEPGGQAGEEVNVTVVKVGDCVENNVVENNKVANISGGLCGIGIIGAGCCNLIDQNKLSGSCVNASAGVFNTFYSMKTANDFLKARPLDNLAFVNICC